MIRKRNGMVSLISGAQTVHTGKVSTLLLGKILRSVVPNPDALAVVVLHIPVKKDDVQSILRMIRDAEEL